MRGSRFKSHRHPFSNDHLLSWYCIFKNEYVNSCFDFSNFFTMIIIWIDTCNRKHNNSAYFMCHICIIVWIFCYLTISIQPVNLNVFYNTIELTIIYNKFIVWVKQKKDYIIGYDLSIGSNNNNALMVK